LNVLLWNLFLTFSKVSVLGFGGGYAIIPLLMAETDQHHWIVAGQMLDTIAIAAMSPGPVAANAAIGIGLLAAGPWGIIMACLGTLLPCLLLVWCVAVFFQKANQNIVVQNCLYGLKAVIPGIIFYAALKMGIQDQIFFVRIPLSRGWDIFAGQWHFDGQSILLLLLVWFFLTKTKLHPILLLIISAFAGVVFFRV
jgi:chromate transporter